MKNLYIKHNGVVIAQYSFNDNEIIVFEDITNKYIESFLKDVFPAYNKNEHIYNYWFENNGNYICEKSKMKMSCDFDLTLRCNIVYRNKPNIATLYFN